MAELFPDCEVGAEPPIGRLYGMTTLMDESLTADDHVTFQAGTHSDAVTMTLGRLPAGGAAGDRVFREARVRKVLKLRSAEV